MAWGTARGPGKSLAPEAKGPRNTLPCLRTGDAGQGLGQLGRFAGIARGTTYLLHCSSPQDSVSERLRRWIRNPLGSARRGLKPLAVEIRWHKPFWRVCVCDVSISHLSMVLNGQCNPTMRWQGIWHHELLDVAACMSSCGAAYRGGVSRSGLCAFVPHPAKQRDLSSWPLGNAHQCARARRPL